MKFVFEYAVATWTGNLSVISDWYGLKSEAVNERRLIKELVRDENDKFLAFQSIIIRRVVKKA